MMSFTTAARLVLALALAPAALAGQRSAAGDTAARPISLDEAVRLAQRNAPQAVQARGLLRSSRASVSSAYSAFIPSFNLTAGTTRTSGSRYDQNRNEIIQLPPIWSYNDGFTAGLVLFDGASRFFDMRRARANLHAADANEILQRYNVALDVKQQYYAVIAARESEAAARAQLQQATQQLRAATARVSAGAATKSDSLRSVIQVGNAQLALVTAQNNLRVANSALTRLVATPFPVTAAGDTSALVPSDIDTVSLAGLVEHGPAVLQAEAQLVAARAAKRSARSPYLPTVSAQYSRGRNGSSENLRYGADTLFYGSAVSLRFSYPIFNQWQREEAAVQASVAEDNAEAALRDARLRVQQDLTQYVGALRSAAQSVQIQHASVAAAEEDLRVQQQRYALGASTLLDVLTSQTQLNQARAALIQARYDARVARAQIEALIGRDLAVPAGTP